MRTGALLVADTLDRYQPLGAFGQPVYLSYVQLKAAVRQKLGIRCANYFSRPDRDPRGHAIRWLSDVPGTAVRWRDLPHGDQVAHALELHEMRSAFQKYLGDLRGQPGSAQEAAAFASLLENALLVPDDEHLFFVDGQPMVSFWGFRNGEGAGFDALSVAPAAVAAAAIAVSSLPVARPRRPWWQWLLLGLLSILLLLGLALGLLVALRGCELPGGFRLPLPNAVCARPAIPGTALPNPQSPDTKIEPARPDPALPRKPDTRTPDGAVIVPPGVAVPGAPAVAPPVLVPVPPAPAQPNGAPPKAATPDQLPPVKPPAAQSPAAPVPPPPVVKPVPVPDAALRPPVPGAAPPSLVIPPESEKSGSVAFLEGWWRSRTGLVNRQDNTPLQQLYRFDREGRGEVVIRRADGTECRAPARAVLGPNGLDVTELGDPTCPDGTKFGRSRTTCRRDAAGQTQCFGVNDDSSTYSIPVERLP